MRIAIISGGKYKNESSHIAASHLYTHLHHKCDKLHMIKVEESGAWTDKGIVTDMHKVLPQVDHVIDLRHVKKTKAEINLIKKLGLIDHILDNYENDFIKKLCYQLDISHPRYFIIRKEERAIEQIMHEMWRRIHLPIRIVSNSYNNTQLLTYDYKEAVSHIKYLHNKGDDVVVEEMQNTHMLRVISVRSLRNKQVYVTLPFILNNHNKFRLDQIVTELEMKELDNILNKLYKVLDHNILAVEFTNLKGRIQIIGVSTKIDLSEGSIDYRLLSDLGISIEELVKAAS